MKTDDMSSSEVTTAGELSAETLSLWEAVVSSWAAMLPATRPGEETPVPEDTK